MGEGPALSEFIRRIADRTALLRLHLDAAVPMWIEKLRHLPPDEQTLIPERLREQLRPANARVTAIYDTPAPGRPVAGDELADVLTYMAETLIGDASARHPDGRAAHAFNAIAQAIAVCALRPGGIDLFGRHWEATR